MPSSPQILTIVGARPQFIKAAAFSRALRDEKSKSIRETIIYTGQHFDKNMSKSFDVDFVIVYQDTGTELLQELQDSFSILSEFDWGLLSQEIRENKMVAH